MLVSFIILFMFFSHFYKNVLFRPGTITKCSSIRLVTEVNGIL